ncbi:MAG: DEAD/DEAH box helicase, partial [Spirochaetales bacterium]|nr:DEAD/DEAH box helicase [Spirochaetales bacterium]
ILRRTKAAVAPELPARIDSYLHCTMAADQTRFYDTLRKYHRTRVVAAISAGEIAEIGTAIFTGLLRLRQAAFYPEDAADNGKGVSSAKEEELLKNLMEVTAEGNKALVFSQFVTALKHLERRFAAAGIKTLRLDGRTRNRTDLIESFQSFEGPIVFLISLRAGGTGINLTAADYVFVCDPWWNPAVERQAIDRAHRIGRQSPVFVYRVITEGTVEHKVMELQEQKRQLAADLIAEDTDGLASSVADSSAEELLSLFD